MTVKGAARRIMAHTPRRGMASPGGMIGICFLLAGCMTVQIETGGSQVKIFQHVGLLQIELEQPNKAIVGALHGVGIVATPMGWSAGYTRQRWAAIGPQCRAVLWVNGTVDDSLRRDLERLAGVCLVEDSGAANSEKNVSIDKEIGL